MNKSFRRFLGRLKIKLKEINFKLGFLLHFVQVFTRRMVLPMSWLTSVKLKNCTPFQVQMRFVITTFLYTTENPSFEFIILKAFCKSESWFAIPRPTVICFTVRMYVQCSLVDNRVPFCFTQVWLQKIWQYLYFGTVPDSIRPETNSPIWLWVSLSCNVLCFHCRHQIVVL